jgi:4-hydroxybenzoate polyprenyltransferase
MADREDDLKAGVKSTAILFGDLDRIVIAGLQLIWLTALAFIGHQMQWPWPWWAGLAGVLILFIWQWRHTASRDKHLCLAAFKHNHWVGLVLFVSLLMAWLQMLALP